MEEFYYGLPQELWDDLAYLAEENLEKEICFSAHMLGLYPYGARLHGIESESPGLLCLYSDSTINRLLDPFIKQKEHRPEKIIVKADGSYIYYIDLWSWLSSLDNQVDFIHMVPCLGDLVHEDSSIRKIISLSEELICSSQVRRNCTWVEDNNLFNSACALRTGLIFAKDKLFLPCLNKDWGGTFRFYTLPDDIQLIDDKILRQEKLEQKELVDYRSYVHAITNNIGVSDDWWKKRSRLTEEVIKYFRFQL
jgi:hypothetical protein